MVRNPIGGASMTAWQTCQTISWESCKSSPVSGTLKRKPKLTLGPGKGRKPQTMNMARQT